MYEVYAYADYHGWFDLDSFHLLIDAQEFARTYLKENPRLSKSEIMVVQQYDF